MTLSRRLTAEFFGTAMLLAIVVGSGIMGERLAGGNAAIALLGNTIATGAGLVVLIHMFGPISGAHFNPAVTLAALLQRQSDTRTAAAYILAQMAGGERRTIGEHNHRRDVKKRSMQPQPAAPILACCLRANGAACATSI